MGDRLAELGITRGVLALCLLWLVAVGPIVHDMTAQGAPRFALTGALVDDGSIRIDGYALDYDRADRDGHTYSDKAPGQEFLAVPFYAAARAVGAEPAIVPRLEGNASLWWVTLWSSGAPAISIILMASVATHRRGILIPLPALAGLAFGTMLLPFSATLYGHVLGAALGFGAWLVLDGGPGWRRGVASGALIGLAVSVEYQVLIVGVVMAGWLAVRGRWPQLVAFGAAGLPFALAVGAYQAAAFGSPFSSGYTDKADHAGASMLITGVPDPVTLVQVLVGARGLLLFTPVVAVGIYGLWSRWRSERDDGAVVALAVVVGFILLQAGWVNPWGGDGPGPRYVTPMLPFLAIGLAGSWNAVPAAWRRWVLGVSVVSMALPTITLHLMPKGSVLIAGSLAWLPDEGVNPTVWSLWLGPLGWVVYLGSVGWATSVLVRAHRSQAEVPALQVS